MLTFVKPFQTVADNPVAISESLCHLITQQVME